MSGSFISPGFCALRNIIVRLNLNLSGFFLGIMLTFPPMVCPPQCPRSCMPRIPRAHAACIQARRDRSRLPLRSLCQVCSAYPARFALSPGRIDSARCFECAALCRLCPAQCLSAHRLIQACPPLPCLSVAYAFPPHTYL